MARSTKHLINVHTSTGTTEPSGANLYLGEIAVQHTPENPALWIKMGTGETSEVYEKFIGSTEINNLISNVTTLGSGYTYSGIPYVNSSTTFADAYSALTNELIIDEETISAAFNDVNDRIIELSGRTVPTRVSQLENDVPYVTSAETTGMLTGVSMNGLEASVTNHVANLGNVVTAETQLSTATTGNGNVITSLSVSNHQITTNKGMTIPDWATAATKPTYTASEVGALPTGTTLDGMPDGTTRKLSDFFKNAEYDSGTKRINFKNGDTVLDYIDATDFIKDGMVSAVTISGSNMVISFNTDAGKEDITLSLTDIFNPENYYDKDHINSALTHYLPLSGGQMDANAEIIFGQNTFKVGFDSDSMWNQITMGDGYLRQNELQLSDTVDARKGGLRVDDTNMTAFYRTNTYTFPSTSGTLALTSDISNTLGSGYTYSGIPYVNSSTTIADAYSALTKEFLDDEEAIAQIVNDLDSRINILSGKTVPVPTKVSELVNDVPYVTESAFTEGLEALSASVVANKTKITSNERVTAMALNDLNDRKADKPESGSSIPVGGLKPNTFYDLGTLSAATTFALEATTNPADEYMIQFSMGATVYTPTWPVAIQWLGGSEPTWNANKTYQVSIQNNLAVAGEF